MINKFIGIGHLTKDPETKSFESSNTKCSFSLAINSSKDEVLFMDTECWNKTAENCKKFISKGSCVYVEGKIKVSKWEDKAGNSRQKFYLNADLVRFLPNGKKESPGGLETKAPGPSPSVQSIVEEEDMPF
jgi:single-strand DNA-binding protein